MKQIITTILLLTISASSFSQQMNPLPELAKQDYLKKSKTQKTVAWILLGGGLGLATAGTAIMAYEITGAFVDALITGEGQTSSTGMLMLITGGVSTLGSIPLFIGSSRNKRKAMEFSFNNQKLIMWQGRSFISEVVPSLSFRVHL